MRRALSRLAAEKELLVFVGDGGVGKTSAAAATALAAARGGRRVAVLTVDPAPRLGDALGLGTLGTDPVEVDLPRHCRGSLTAMRLDTKGSFDRLVEALAPDSATASTLAANPIYTAVSSTLGGSDSYIAFQRLHELMASGSHDLIVVDTPPALHAGELLSAPTRLAALMDSGAWRIIADPALALARAGSAFTRAATALALAVLERIMGAAIRRQVNDFVGGFDRVLKGLSRRAGEVSLALRAPSTAFVMVLRPTAASVDSGLTFLDELLADGLPVAVLLVNRITPAPPPLDPGLRALELKNAPEGTAQVIEAMEGDLEGLRLAEAAGLARLKHALGLRKDLNPTVMTAPALESGLNNLDELGRLAGLLSD